MNETEVDEAKEVDSSRSEETTHCAERSSRENLGEQQQTDDQ